MKKLWFFLAMFVCVLASCSDGGSDDPSNPTPKPEEVKTEITIDSGIVTNGLSFDTEAGEKSLSFSVNANWTLSIASTTSGATWCKASATSGSKGSANVKFTVDENTSYDDRSVSITIKAGTVSKTFTITQKGADAMLVTTTKYEVAQEGGKIEVEVKANVEYQMAISETAKDWITETKSKSRGLTTYKHSFDIAMNEENEKREGEITFKSGDKVETVKVYQAGGAIILLTKDEYTVSDAGETISVDIKSNVEFGVQMPDVDWITDEATGRGMSSHTLKYVIAPNEGYDSRSAEIVFYDQNSDLKDTLRVVQVQKDAIVISQKTYDVKSEGETIEVKFSSNVDLEVIMPDVDWVTQVESRSLTERALYFKVAKNVVEEERRTEIVFANKDSQLSEKITIIQQGISYLKLTENEFAVSDAGGTIEVEVKSNVEYGIQMPEAEWIFQDVSGRGVIAETLKFIVDVNETCDSRSAEIIFYDKNSELKEVLKVIQEPTERIILSEKNIVISDSKGGTFEVRINKTIDYRIGYFFADWIKEESVDYSNHAIKYMVGSNNDVNSREGFLVFWDKNSALSDTITIIQSGLEPATDFEMISLGDNLSMHSKGLALQYEGITDFYDFFDAIYDETICKKIYTKFEDAFDFIFFLYNTSGEEFSYGGFSYPINRNISGIGRENVDISSRFGTNGKLRNVNHLTLRTSLFSEGPFLHELAHHWGAAYIGQEYATPNGTYGTESHWGTTDINGVLGGFDYSTLERNVDNNPKKYRATCSRSKKWGFDGFSQELSSEYFAPMELYLMGLIPASEVPDMHVFKNVKIEDYSGTFYADSEITYTIEDFIAKYGERVPDYQSSQKDFRALVVVVTNEPVSPEHWTLIERDILKQEKQASANDIKQTNFWEATGGRATLTISGIDKFLKR